MRQTAGKLLIATGALIILSAVIMKGYAGVKQDALMQEYRVYVKSLRETEEAAKDEMPRPEEGSVIGILTIPAVEVETPLMEGIGGEDLKAAAGHFPGTSLPGKEGNCCIAGHRSYTYGECFNRLGELTGGELIQIDAFGETYVYAVTEILVVEPEDLEVLEPETAGAKELTLVTCTPVRSATHRLIIKGSLIEYKNAG